MKNLTIEEFLERTKELNVFFNLSKELELSGEDCLGCETCDNDEEYLPINKILGTIHQTKVMSEEECKSVCDEKEANRIVEKLLKRERFDNRKKLFALYRGDFDCLFAELPNGFMVEITHESEEVGFKIETFDLDFSNKNTGLNENIVVNVMEKLEEHGVEFSGTFR